MIEFEIDKKDMARINGILKKLDFARRSGVLRKAFVAGTAFVENRLKQNISGKILKVRTGRLRSSMGSMITGEGFNLEAVVGSGVRTGERVSYADIHETGGTITPKRARMLTIPLKQALTAAGAPRFTAAQVRDGLTQYQGSFIRGNIVFGKTSTGGAVPLFVLKHSIHIPARRYMSRTVEETASEVVEIMARSIQKEIDAS